MQCPTYNNIAWNNFIRPQDVSEVITQIPTTIADAVNWVASNIKYITDIKNHGRIELFQKPGETLASRSGDCEDTAFLLSSILYNMRIPNRVATGTRYGCGHAWVEAEDPETKSLYVLESTDGQIYPWELRSIYGYQEQTYVYQNGCEGAVSPIPLIALIGLGFVGLIYSMWR